MRQLQGDHQPCARLGDPARLGPAARSGIDDDPVLERIGRTEGIGDRMDQPVLLEVDEIEIVPLVAKRLDCLAGIGQHGETWDAIDNRICLARSRHQPPGDDATSLVQRSIVQPQWRPIERIAQVIEQHLVQFNLLGL